MSAIYSLKFLSGSWNLLEKKGICIVQKNATAKLRKEVALTRAI
jgi:hypothetical protein